MARDPLQRLVRGADRGVAIAALPHHHHDCRHHHGCHRHHGCRHHHRRRRCHHQEDKIIVIRSQQVMSTMICIGG